jgi:hypothetical protein
MVSLPEEPCETVSVLGAADSVKVPLPAPVAPTVTVMPLLEAAWVESPA